MIDDANDNDAKSRANLANEKECRISLKTAHYLYENCSKNTLNELSNVINNGILKQECHFDDSLLFLSKLIDCDSLVKNLEQTTSNCLTKNKKNAKSYLYFKHNLLNSKIWGTIDDSNKKKDRVKQLQLRITAKVILAIPMQINCYYLIELI